MQNVQELKYTFYEINEILKNMPTIYREKLPEEMKKMIQKNMKKNNFKYDITKSLDKQEMLYTTKTMLSVLYRKYWCSPAERKRLDEKDEQYLEEKYNIDNIFKNRKKSY